MLCLKCSGSIKMNKKLLFGKDRYTAAEALPLVRIASFLRIAAELTYMALCKGANSNPV